MMKDKDYFPREREKEGERMGEREKPREKHAFLMWSGKKAGEKTQSINLLFRISRNRICTFDFKTLVLSSLQRQHFLRIIKPDLLFRVT